MSSGLHNMFTPRRKRGKTWDADAQTGTLWMWAGKFKRWKRREFSAQQPGLLKYHSRERRGKKSKGHSINLHGASVEISSSDARMIILRSSHLGKIFLRTTDPDDRQPCVESIQRSINSFGTLLSRASAVFGVPQQEAEIMHTLKSNSSNQAAKLAEEPHVAKELFDRMASNMKGLEAHKSAFETQLSGVQSQLRALAAVLDVSSEAKSAPPDGQLKSHQEGNDSLRRTRTGKAGPPFELLHADSFESALSELQHSPSWQEPRVAESTGDAAGNPLSRAWQAYNDAVEAAIRNDALRVIELQAENEALKTAMRNFKNRAVAMRATASRTDVSGRASLDRLGSSGSDDEGTNTPLRQQSDDMAHSSSKETDFAVEDASKVRGMSLASSEEYRKALEALEAIQRHAFEVSSQRAEQTALPIDEPPPDTDNELDEAPSDEDNRSERGSRALINLQTENPWEAAAKRERLPAPAPLQRGFSIWSVLKNALGKDLTRITLPATINEPLSALQRIVEDLEYRHLLDQAVASQDPSERMLLVATFIASGYSASLGRESKPFNPLLGETFEWQPADMSCRFVCEQVSHHPPISCWWSDSAAGWTYWGEVELRSKFWGKSVEMMPTGTCWLQLGEELWSWDKPNMTINNIILGSIWLEWHGKITIYNHTAGRFESIHIAGTSTSLSFPKCNGQLEERGAVQCVIQPEKGGRTWQLKGKYTDRLCSVSPASKLAPETELFRINEPPEQSSLQYNLTRLAMTLNTAEPELLRQLPPTDSRLRPDQRFLEDGDLDKATPEKMRLEEKQREARKVRKERGESFFPAWFRLRTLTDKQKEGADHWLGTKLVRLPGQPPPCLWEFTGSYWEAKQQQDWSHCPDIYSGGPEQASHSI